MNRGGQVGHLVAERQCLQIPRRIPADIDVEWFGGQYPRLGQHRQRGIGAVGIKPCGGFVVVQVPLGQHDQQLVQPALL